MIIGIDVDDTLVSSSESFDELLIRHNINFKKRFKDDWTQEEKDFIFGNYLEEVLVNAKLKEGAKEALDYLDELGYKLIIITARSNKYCKDIEDKTRDFIKQENLKISEVYFGRSKKSDLAKKLNLDLMIDDSLYVYNNMKEENIDCILFGDEIKSWKEVLDYIERKVKQNG